MTKTIDGALDDYKRSHRGGSELPDEAIEAYTCDALGITPLELRSMDYETVTYMLAWHEGKNLAEFACAEAAKRPSRQR